MLYVTYMATIIAGVVGGSTRTRREIAEVDDGVLVGSHIQKQKGK